MDTIYLLVEGISLLDMLMSFATLASMSKGYSRPIFEAVRLKLNTPSKAWCFELSHSQDVPTVGFCWNFVNVKGK